MDDFTRQKKPSENSLGYNPVLSHVPVVVGMRVIRKVKEDVPVSVQHPPPGPSSVTMPPVRFTPFRGCSSAPEGPSNRFTPTPETRSNLGLGFP